MTFAHKNIRRFEIAGQVADEAHIPKFKDIYIAMLADRMRLEGYLQRLDIDPDISVSYDGKVFAIKVSVFGIYVGKRKAQCYAAADRHRPIPLVRSKEFSIA